VDRLRDKELSSSGTRLVHPEDYALVVEVTSPSNANNDREPGLQHRTRNGQVIHSKWTGYARTGTPFYLLVDRDPRVARSILYSEPDPATCRYTEAVAWEFGDVIRLPEPFGFEIAAAEWQPWQS